MINQTEIISAIRESQKIPVALRETLTMTPASTPFLLQLQGQISGYHMQCVDCGAIIQYPRPHKTFRGTICKNTRSKVTRIFSSYFTVGTLNLKQGMLHRKPIPLVKYINKLEHRNELGWLYTFPNIDESGKVVILSSVKEASSLQTPVIPTVRMTSRGLRFTKGSKIVYGSLRAYPISNAHFISNMEPTSLVDTPSPSYAQYPNTVALGWAVRNPRAKLKFNESIPVLPLLYMVGNTLVIPREGNDFLYRTFGFQKLRYT